MPIDRFRTRNHPVGATDRPLAPPERRVVGVMNSTGRRRARGTHHARAPRDTRAARTTTTARRVAARTHTQPRTPPRLRSHDGTNGAPPSRDRVAPLRRRCPPPWPHLESKVEHEETAPPRVAPAAQRVPGCGDHAARDGDQQEAPRLSRERQCVLVSREESLSSQLKLPSI